MADQLTEDDLLAAVDAAIPDTYLDPMKAEGDGYELVRGMAAVGARCSQAVRRFEIDGYILSSKGAALASVLATFYRATDTAGAVTILAGSIVRASAGGQTFRLIENAIFGATDLEASATARAVGYGYEWNIRGPFVDPQGATWPGELDTIDLPLQDPPFTDTTILVRNDADADGLGRPGTLDAIGDGERNLPRQPNETDTSYSDRIRTLPDTISPAAILRQIKNYLRPYPIWWRAIETWEHAYQECYDAVDEAASADFGGDTYDANLCCYDDPRDPSPMQNRWLAETDHLGAFIVEIATPPAIEDFGMAYDDPANDEADVTTTVGIRAFSAFDVPDSLAPPALPGCYDGVDFGIDRLFSGLFDLLEEIKAAGIFVTIHIKEI